MLADLLTALFLKYIDRNNALLRYLSDSSYWVYLVHMLGTVGFGVLLYNLPLSGLEKMAINILLTSLACLLSYHWLVRSTWVGRLLNGRRRAGLETVLASPERELKSSNGV